MLQTLEYGITGRALKEKRLKLECWNPRDFTQDKHRTVDDRPYGGGPGMIMMAEPVCAAINAAKAVKPQAKVIFLSPQGKQFDQAAAERFLQEENLILIAGRYEGIDERVLSLVDEEYSIGDYVLSGGELAAMVMIDAITRLIPGALGHEDSAALDSLSDDLLKYPQYTRPENFQDFCVPSVLLSGNHQAIERWRLQQSLGRTWLKRPDLLARKSLDPVEQALLQEFIEELKRKQSHE